ncbi:MAG: SpoIIE family protein phosphatase [bacterium]|nr:SpoIIE family protein phosphatase [bacterium]
MKEKSSLKLPAQLRLIEKATDVAAEGIIITDALQPHNPIIYVNDGFVRLTGFSKEEILGQNCRFLQGEGTNPQSIDLIRQAVREQREVIVELLNYRKDGTPFWNRLSIAPLKDDSGKTTHFVGVQSDITEQKHTKQELEVANNELAKFQKEMLFELEQAKKAQEFILPAKLPKSRHVKIASKFVPLAQIGGDFFDIVELKENTFGILIADVTGHGIPAALLTFMSSITFKNLSPGTLSTKDVLRQTNEILFGQMPGGTFISMFYLIYDTLKKELTFSQAGHPPGFLLRRKTNEVKKLIADGTLIGIFPNSYSNFGEEKIQIEPGDKIFLYTDAIIEAFSKKGEMFDLKDLQVMLQEHIDLPIDQLLEEVYQHGLEFSGKPSYDDDATLVGFEVLE